MSCPPPTAASDDLSHGLRTEAPERKFLPEAAETYCATDAIGAVADASFRRLMSVTADPGVRNFLWRMLSIRG